jgi:hypothetical protein
MLPVPVAGDSLAQEGGFLPGYYGFLEGIFFCSGEVSVSTVRETENAMAVPSPEYDLERSSSKEKKVKGNYSVGATRPEGRCTGK